MSATYDPVEFLVDIARKWQERWYKDKVFEADPEPGKPKFFLTAAFPYPNSPMHIGHGRTYTIADIYARYMRMKGYNTLFPMAFHYTGTPILTMAEELAKGDEELVSLFLEVYNIPKDDIEKLKDPLTMARYFHEDFKKSMASLGYSIDWRREFTSIDVAFKKFVEWQFEKLREKNYITQGTHPVGWCPIHESPVGQHDTKGDVEPEIDEFTLILFRDSEGIIYPCATFRPETVYGAVNVWINPKAEYVKAEVNGKVWIISERAAFKLRFQNRKVKILEKFHGEKLLGIRVENPATKAWVPVLPASFVDPNNGTGVVMSVPAHAPYDYVALKEILKDREVLNKLKVKVEELEPIPMIKVKGYGKLPAKDVVESMGIIRQDDPKLEEATKKVYRDEYHYGIMLENTGKYSGMKVSEVKDVLIKDFKDEGIADSMYEIINSPVYCRCGAEVVVKIFENQWFINYGDEKWKELAREALSNMKIIPPEAKKDFQYTIEWVKEKACARQRGLGTPLPWSKKWIIESLSDSTIYMAFYTISHLLKEYDVDANKLNTKFFDYIFLGIGDVDEVAKSTGVPIEAIKRMREEFLYWYPLDSRHSAKDLVPNHLTFFIFNHVAIFPKELWPKQIVINGFIMYEGKKMSKSLRNILPISRANKSYGPDTVRLTLVATAETTQDADFSDKVARSIMEKIMKIHDTIAEISKMRFTEKPKLEHMDKWMLSILQRRIQKTTEAMEQLRFREAVNQIFYMLDNDLRWYLERVGEDNELREETIGYVCRKVAEEWVKMIAPFTPHIAEELWEMLGKKPYVSLASWPKVEHEMINVEDEVIEEYYIRVLNDVKEILKATGATPKKIIFYLPSEWKYEVFHKALETVGHGGDLKDVIREVMKDKRMREIGKKAVDIVRKVYDLIMSMSPSMRDYLKTLRLDEHKVLTSNIKHIIKSFNCEQVEIYEEDSAPYDPKGRAKLALPYRPAIYIE